MVVLMPAHCLLTVGLPIGIQTQVVQPLLSVAGWWLSSVSTCASALALMPALASASSIDSVVF